MYVTIQKWANSHGIRLSKTILENGNLILIPVKKQTTLQERIADYDGDYICTEWDTGEPKGNEVL